MFAALLESALNEDLQMIGFRSARRASGGVPVLARVSACSPYDTKPKIDVWLSPIGKKRSAMPKLVAAFQAKLPSEVLRTKGAEFTPGVNGGRSEGKVCTGLAEICSWTEQGGYGDSTYIGIRADRDEMGRVVAEICKDVLKGESITGSDGEYIFRESYHSIGD